MFSTSGRGRRAVQRGSSPPPSGVDSCYGVRSLNGSVWSESPTSDRLTHGPSSINPDTDPDPRASSSADTVDCAETEEFGSDRSPSPEMTPTSATLHELPPHEDISRTFSDPESHLPPSPGDTLHPLDGSEITALEDQQDGTQYPHPYHPTLLAHLEALADVPSLPSSPASFTSLSYVASLSSLSRTSSPVSGIAYHRQSHPIGIGGLGEIEDDLVLPTLSLPSTSLHMSLPHYEGNVSGLKIGVVGNREDARDLIRGLEERRDIVDLGKGRVGVVSDGEVVATIVITQTVEQMYIRVEEAYVKLDGLLNPSPPLGREGEVRSMITDYAAKNDWVHLVYSLGGDSGQFKEIARLSPTMTSSSLIDGSLDGLFRLPTAEPSPELSRASTPSPPELGDERTPMPSLSRAHSYFTPRPAPIRPVDTIIRIIDAAAATTNASIAKFLQWRNVPLSNIPTVSTPINSSPTTSPASSSYGSHQPMPTVARASGGADWEANLSRRVANAHARKRGTKPRRSFDRAEAERAKQRERERRHGPLFPRSSPKISSVGLRDMWAGCFGDGTWLRQRVGWRLGLVAAAVMVAVGWGCWVKAQ